MTTLLERAIELVFNEHKGDRPASAQGPRPQQSPLVLTRAELAECTCPDPCERDHEND
jgi:hypothetical protein